MENNPAVIYAAKSTEDEGGSIGDQLRDCRALAEQEGWPVEGKFQDEAASAFKGNRGDGLQAAMERAEELAPCVLVVQHSSRLARGDAKQAKHLIEYALWAVQHNVRLASVENPWAFTEGEIGWVMSGLAGMADNAFSKRLSTSVRTGTDAQPRARSVARTTSGRLQSRDG